MNIRLNEDKVNAKLALKNTALIDVYLNRKGIKVAKTGKYKGITTYDVQALRTIFGDNNEQFTN